MPKDKILDLEKERKALDREITFFHFARAKLKVRNCLAYARKINDRFFLNYFLAQKSILNQDFSQAVRYLNRCLELRENDGCAYNDKALCLIEAGHYSQAKACFDEGIARDPDCATLYHNKGWLLNVLGEHKKAVLCFKKALELEDWRPESWYSLADSWANLGDRKQAKKYFYQAKARLKGKCRVMHDDVCGRLAELG